MKPLLSRHEEARRRSETGARLNGGQSSGGRVVVGGGSASHQDLAFHALQDGLDGLVVIPAPRVHEQTVKPVSSHVVGRVDRWQRVAPDVVQHDSLLGVREREIGVDGNDGVVIRDLVLEVNLGRTQFDIRHVGQDFTLPLDELSRRILKTQFITNVYYTRFCTKNQYELGQTKIP